MIKKYIEIYNKWEKKYFDMKIPTDDIERTRVHYIGCIIYFNTKTIVYNSISFFLLPIAFLFSLKKRNINKVSQADAVIVSPNKNYLLKDEDLPVRLNDSYKNRIKVIIERRTLYKELFSCSIDDVGRALVKQLIRKYPFAFYMNLSVWLHISRYYKLTLKYNPNAFITTQTEQDFTTSAITNYCEHRGIKYIGVQHGEYCYNPSMAYMRFSEYYAWSKETIENLELVNTKIDFAYIYKPKQLQQRLYKNAETQFFLTYYLSSEKESDVIKIKDILLQFTKAGYSCCVRKHPRFLSLDLITRLFKNTGIAIEDGSLVSLDLSICNTKYVVAYRSTVLSIAYANNMPIIIDDVVGDISKLIRVHDVNIERSTMLLSRLMDITFNNNGAIV